MGRPDELILAAWAIALRKTLKDAHVASRAALTEAEATLAQLRSRRTGGVRERRVMQR